MVGKWKTRFGFSTFPFALVVGAVGVWKSRLSLARFPRECTMNAFYEHHKQSIEFGYRCFDRLLLNGLIQLFSSRNGFWNSSTATVMASGFTRRTLTDIVVNSSIG